MARREKKTRSAASGLEAKMHRISIQINFSPHSRRRRSFHEFIMQRRERESDLTMEILSHGDGDGVDRMQIQTTLMA